MQISLELISKNIEKITELRDGSLLVLVKDKQSADKFISAKLLPGICEIKCKFHENLNFVKGTIFAPYLTMLSDEEITKELASEGVVNVFKFTKMENNKAVHTGAILLTFDLYKLPEKIDISWHKARVREYFPNPMRCKQCQELGHTKKHCHKPALCQTCSFPPHDDNCARVQCVNCEEKHPSNFNKCAKFLEQKEILKIKIQRRCTMKEAKDAYQAQFPRASAPFSFAGVANPSNNDTTTPKQHNTNNKVTNELPENKKINFF